MPLLIELKSGDKIFINGAVIENTGPNTRLILHNEATVMREREVLNEDSAVTPASRVYHTLQCAYLFKDSRDDYLRAYDKFLDDYLAACPSALEIGNKIRKQVSEGKIYKGLKEAKALIHHENETLATLHNQLKAKIPEILENDSAASETEPSDDEQSDKSS